MHYVDLIADRPIIWSLFALYLLTTSYLAWLGHRRTRSMASFAVGDGDMSPWIVGLTLAASIASTATFVLNPGFVYVHGVAALMHYGVAVSIGIIVGLTAFSVGFRRIGERTRALTLPQWIGNRYGSRRLSVLFACISLLSLTFVVLIIGAISIVMQINLGLSNVEALTLVVAFVFGYVFIGGTYAHAYTNTLQAIIMTVIALVIVGSGVPLLLEGDLAGRLAAVDPNLTGLINPTSELYSSFFSVYVSGFVIGVALVCQPHILSKALYVKDDAAVRKYLGITIAVSMVFTMMLLVGLYAHLAEIPRSAFLDPATGQFRQDLVLTVYLEQTFSAPVLAIITVAILSAGMSTLDGILVALSSIAGNDLFLNLAGRRLEHLDADKRGHLGHRVSQLVLVSIGVASFVIALDPPELLGIFGQVGVYGIVAATTVPILYGIFFPAFTARGAFFAATLGLTAHFGLYTLGDPETFANPGVSASVGILIGAVAALPFAWPRSRTRASGAVGVAASLASHRSRSRAPRSASTV